MSRVAFLVLGTSRWIGGKHYVANLISITKTYQKRLEPVLFCPTNISKEELNYYKKIEGLLIVQTCYLNNLISKFALMMSILLGCDYLIRSLCKKHDICTIFTNTKYLGWRFPIPVVVWIPDLQHRFLKHLFSKFGFLFDVVFLLTIVLEKSKTSSQSQAVPSNSDSAFTSGRSRCDALVAWDYDAVAATDACVLVATVVAAIVVA